MDSRPVSVFRFPVAFSRIVMGCTLAVCLGAPFSLPAAAQGRDDTENRLRRMENEIQTLSRAVYRGERPPEGAFTTSSSESTDSARADVEIRLSRLESEIRTLTGQVETLTFQISSLEDDLANRARQAASPPPPSTPPHESFSPAPSYGSADPYSVSSVPPDVHQNQLGTLHKPAVSNGHPPAPVSSTPESQYESAFALLRGGDFEKAAEGFSAFIRAFPDHALTPNAQYWLGETFYVRGDYIQAARIFADSYGKAPQGSKAPDNLLKLGMSLAGEGKRDDACLTLKTLQDAHASAAPAILSRGRQEMARIGCQ